MTSSIRVTGRPPPCGGISLHPSRTQLKQQLQRQQTVEQERRERERQQPLVITSVCVLLYYLYSNYLVTEWLAMQTGMHRDSSSIPAVVKTFFGVITTLLVVLNYIFVFNSS